MGLQLRMKRQADEIIPLLKASSYRCKGAPVYDPYSRVQQTFDGVPHPCGFQGAGVFLTQSSQRAHRRKKLERALGGVEGDGGEGPEVEIYGGVADLLHEGGEFGRTEEAGDGSGEVGVGGGVAGKGRADARQDASEIPAINIATKAVRRLREFEYGDGAAGF